ncbi:MAG: acetate--CoA ligase [Kiritimatiellaceae bacterium]|nr:acetate--CoA ligase [Kiritimatiellaceae bacterium]
MSDENNIQIYSPPNNVSENSYFPDMETYQELYNKSITDSDTFWSDQAIKNIDWIKPFSQVCDSNLTTGKISWFDGGQLNVTSQCIDRHLKDRASKIAILWEGDEPGDVKEITYQELHDEVCRMANVLRKYGIGKGDRVALYMPMIPAAAYAMLACARIGAIHSVVFAGFSAEALRERVMDSSCKAVITADEGRRGQKKIALKSLVDEAIISCDCVEHVFMYRHTNSDVNFNMSRDVDLGKAMRDEEASCEAEVMESEDPLFILYTSGSTGKPKGLQHSSAGYLLYTMLTHKYVFDYKEDDVYACVADIGWITGHSYVVYGPLANGATTVMFESIPTYPDAGRYWDMVERLKITQFYTAPTAIRAIARMGDSFVEKYDRSSLRVLGSVGEPINPESWNWYYKVVGQEQCNIVDTWWQTETGGIMITPLPGATPTKPGSATFPFFGVEPVILDDKGNELEGNGISGLLAINKPWPSIARTIYGDHERYMQTYLSPFKGYYFTGDGCRRDEDGYYWITGRVDDVINVSGHRMGTAEVESALVQHPVCAEAAVVGFPHEIKGQGIFAYVIIKSDSEESDDLVKQLRQTVREQIGPIATPDHILIAPGLPKTRSGKIMRRILRKIASQEVDQLGDTSTLADPSVVDQLIQKREVL